MPSEQKPRIVETTFRVRFAETDLMGIVHHATYVVYLEEGRSEYGRQVGSSYAALEELGFSLAVADINIRYIAPARYDNLITVRTWLEKMQSRGLTFAYEVVNADTAQLLVTATTRLICIDHSGQVHRFPEAWAAAYRQAATSA